MAFWTRLFGAKEVRCSNCNALIHQSEKKGMCSLCASDPEIAKRRRYVADSQKAKGVLNPRCGKCGTSEEERIRQGQEVLRKGGFIYRKSGPALLYCENCHEYFCGRCQVDLGQDSGCPVCGKNLEQ